MYNHRLIHWVQIFSNHLDSKELKVFKYHLNRPYLEKKQDIQKLFETLMKIHPNLKDEESENQLHKEVIFKKTWGKVKFSPSRLLNTASLLCREMGVFYFQKKAEEDPFLLSKKLLELKEIYRVPSFLNRQVKRWEQSLLMLPESGQKYYELALFHEYKLGYCPRDNFKISDSFEKLKSGLDVFYYTYQLKLLRQEISNDSIFTKKVVDTKKVRDLLKKVRSYNNHDFPLIHLYCELIQFITYQSNPKDFNQILDLFRSYWKRLEIGDAKEFLLIMVDFCIKQIYVGNSKYRSTQFQLYEWGLKFHILATDETLAGSTFLNIIVAAAYVKEFDFIAKFIDEYLPKIDPKEQEAARYMAKAYIEFESGAYQSALYALHLANAKYERYRVRYQYLSLRVHYEIYRNGNEHWDDELLRKIAAYNEFFRTEMGLDAQRREHSLNLGRAVKKMYNYQNTFDAKVRQKELTELNTMVVVGEIWLRNKVKELENDGHVTCERGDIAIIG